ncbi:LuxR family transcriptional regulator [Octadecabacter sp. 1_MG-2023]|uniref:helix-turn-helix transcriptional regulator n=1 Tax=unclassified Octadecabacter TaxID=196158 RepID=UPI001C081B41|nr:MULTISPECIES: LuxR family transcriptional regulator [unclassified Octadecabacter]MBU2991795.1 LuxR family transcriptional regulator [Octadecabacter sp. B2R22]MDO6735768.1 LuxR family transcriptional regulator [Octadecabacter sp. 1_MG-2023]
MQANLRQFLLKLDQATDLSDLQECITALRDHFDVAHLVYHWVSADGEQYGCGTYAASWVQHYLDQGYLRIDPVVIGCFQRFHPVDWKALDWTSKSAITFRLEALSAGVGNQGYSIPIRGPSGQFAMFSISDNTDDSTWANIIEKNRRDWLLCAHSFNQKALELETRRLPNPVKPLSGREVDVLTLLAMGYSRGQVAQTLAISEHTLRAYVEGARFKLGASNTMHAVARAVSEGLIVMGGAARNARGDWPGRTGAAAE